MVSLPDFFDSDEPEDHPSKHPQNAGKAGKEGLSDDLDKDDEDVLSEVEGLETFLSLLKKDVDDGSAFHDLEAVSEWLGGKKERGQGAEGQAEGVADASAVLDDLELYIASLDSVAASNVDRKDRAIGAIQDMKKVILSSSSSMLLPLPAPGAPPDGSPKKSKWSKVLGLVRNKAGPVKRAASGSWSELIALIKAKKEKEKKEKEKKAEATSPSAAAPPAPAAPVMSLLPTPAATTRKLSVSFADDPHSSPPQREAVSPRRPSPLSLDGSIDLDQDKEEAAVPAAPVMAPVIGAEDTVTESRTRRKSWSVRRRESASTTPLPAPEPPSAGSATASSGDDRVVFKIVKEEDSSSSEDGDPPPASAPVQLEPKPPIAVRPQSARPSFPSSSLMSSASTPSSSRPAPAHPRPASATPAKRDDSLYREWESRRPPPKPPVPSFQRPVSAPAAAPRPVVSAPASPPPAAIKININFMSPLVPTSPVQPTAPVSPQPPSTSRPVSAAPSRPISALPPRPPAPKPEPPPVVRVELIKSEGALPGIVVVIPTSARRRELQALILAAFEFHGATALAGAPVSLVDAESLEVLPLTSRTGPRLQHDYLYIVKTTARPSRDDLVPSRVCAGTVNNILDREAARLWRIRRAEWDAEQRLLSSALVVTSRLRRQSAAQGKMAQMGHLRAVAKEQARMAAEARVAQRREAEVRALQLKAQLAISAYQQQTGTTPRPPPGFTQEEERERAKLAKRARKRQAQAWGQALAKASAKP
jgi:hypothetical protein